MSDEMTERSEIPELKGVKMLVWDNYEEDAEVRWVVGKVGGAYPYLTVSEKGVFCGRYTHAKPLPETLEERFANHTLGEVLREGYTVSIVKKGGK